MYFRTFVGKWRTKMQTIIYRARLLSPLNLFCWERHTNRVNKAVCSILTQSIYRRNYIAKLSLLLFGIAKRSRSTSAVVSIRCHRFNEHSCVRACVRMCVRALRQWKWLTCQRAQLPVCCEDFVSAVKIRNALRCATQFLTPSVIHIKQLIASELIQLSRLLFSTLCLLLLTLCESLFIL